MIDVPYAVKRALKDGNRSKQYRFQVLNDDETVDFTIDNDTLVKESVKIDERMCSGDRLKFGLCEGASLEFQYFNHPNIRGRRVKVYLDVAYDNEGTEAYYPLSMGYFDVDQCSTQFSTGIIKAVAYNKLRSDYLDSKVNSEIIDVVEAGTIGSAGILNIALILSDLLEGYTILSDNVISEIDTISNTTPANEVAQFKLASTGMIGYVGFPRFLHIATIVGQSADRSYRMTVNPKKIYEIMMDYAEDSGLDLDNTYYYDSQYQTPTPFTLRDFLEEAANYISLDNANGSAKVYISRNKETEKIVTEWVGNATLTLDIPLYWGACRPTAQGQAPTLESAFTTEQKEEADRRAAAIINDSECVFIEEIDSSGISSISFTTEQARALPDVTLRELQSAVYETSALYGQLDRDTDLFYGVELNSGSLTPSASLYPSATLYPNQGYGSNIFRPFPSEYQKLWTDSVGEQTFRYLIITYKAIEYDQQGNPTEVDKTLQRTVHEHGTTNYNCSDNWLFRNLVWTAEQVGAYADAMVEKMLNIRWFPFEMWSTGLPYVEVGDAIEIADKEGDTHISYVLQRQLNGIQNLQDTYINGQLDIF